MDGTEAYARFQIPAPAPGPCPPWCTRDHSREQLPRDTAPGRGQVGHWCPNIGGAIPAGEDFVRVGLAWTERFENGAWQPPRAGDLTVYLGYGIDAAIAFEATERNLAGLDAIGPLISPAAAAP